MSSATRKFLGQVGRYGGFFIASGAERLVGSVGQVLIAPLYIHTLGLENYGGLVSYNLIVATLLALDFGMARSVQRFVAEDDGQHARLAMNVFSSLALILGGLLLAGAVLFALADRVLLCCALVGAALGHFLNLAVSGLRGAHEFVVAGNRMTQLRVLTLAGTAFVAWSTHSLELVLCIAVGCSGISALLVFREAMRRLDWSPSRHWEVSVARRVMLSFSLWSWGQNLLSFVVSNADRMLVSLFLGSAALAVYNLAWSVSTGITQLFFAGTSFLFPVAARLNRDGVALHRFYVTGLLVLSAVTASMCFMGYLFMQPLLDLWVGRQVAEQVHDLMILALAVVPMAVGGITSSAVLNVSGKASNLFRFMLFSHSTVLACTAIGLYLGSAEWMLFGKSAAGLVTGVLMRTWAYRLVFPVAQRHWPALWGAMLPAVVVSALLMYVGIR